MLFGQPILDPYVNYDKILYDLICNRPSYSIALESIKKILAKKNISIKYACDYKNGETALHRLVGCFDWVILIAQPNDEDRKLIQLLLLLVSYDMSCLKVKNNEEKTPLDYSFITKAVLNDIVQHEKKNKVSFTQNLTLPCCIF